MLATGYFCQAGRLTEGDTEAGAVEFDHGGAGNHLMTDPCVAFANKEISMMSRPVHDRLLWGWGQLLFGGEHATRRTRRLYFKQSRRSP